jgi:hypothetical protein
MKSESLQMLDDAGITYEDLSEYTRFVIPEKPFDRKAIQKLIDKIVEWKKNR